MGKETQVMTDLDLIETALEHALLYPSKKAMTDVEYNTAHEEIQRALYALKRVRRVKRGQFGNGRSLNSYSD